MYRKFKEYLSSYSYQPQKFSTKKFIIGEAFLYVNTLLMIIDEREAPMGYEYQVLLEGELHGWISHSILEEVVQRAFTASIVKE